MKVLKKMVERLTQLCELQKTKQNSHGNGSQREKEHETFMHLNKLFHSLLTVCSAASKFWNHMRQPKSDMTDKVYQHNMHRLLGGMKLSDLLKCHQVHCGVEILQMETLEFM
jgi:hypothetical protein